jgi:hypothetical protein
MNIPLPKTSSKAKNVDLNFDLEGALAKIHVTISLKEIIKVPSMKERFEKKINVLDEQIDPPIMLQVDHFRV